MSTSCKFTVTELREKLRAQGLATYGTKAELMARLDLAEPHWRDEAILDTTDDDGATALETLATEGGEVEGLRRQVEVLMREVEQLRGIPEQRPRVNDRHREVNLVLDTLLDSGSPVSFIKNGLVMGPIDFVSELGNEYYGINNSRLQVHGSIRVSLKLDDGERVDVRLLVVPDTTMVNSVILGRDALKKCGLEERRLMTNDESEKD
ncbi:hypothetical protein M0804_013711 [Polistes exclamans]|nr:hypothetical protein M0804_013711 [Polistes exclamans]